LAVNDHFDLAPDPDPDPDPDPEVFFLSLTMK
jgi:hypothetical protein